MRVSRCFFLAVSLLVIVSNSLSHAGPMRDRWVQRYMAVRNLPDSADLLPELKGIVEMEPFVMRELRDHISNGEEVDVFSKDLATLPRLTQALRERIQLIQSSTTGWQLQITQVFTESFLDLKGEYLVKGSVDVTREGDTSTRQWANVQYQGFSALSSAATMVTFEPGQTSVSAPYVMRITKLGVPGSFFLIDSNGSRSAEYRLGSMGSPSSSSGQEEMEKKSDGQVQVLSESSYPLRVIRYENFGNNTLKAVVQNVSDAHIELRIWTKPEHQNNSIPSRIGLGAGQIEKANALFHYLTNDKLPFYFQVVE